ncbi:MAG TPA: amino acid permease [Pyrinomonadaceae bacterium]|nr:amino acid permease [Pyrinomonadaceae bacterium]
MSEEKLVRGIGRWDLTAIAINTIIGTGIFILPARVTGLIGDFSLAAFVVCAVIVGAIVLCYAEVSSRFDATGGMYLYAKEAFGPLVGFEVGWLYWIVRVATFAANCNAFLIYLGFFYPQANDGWLRVVIILAVIVPMTAINLIGVRPSSIMTNVFTVGKIVPLLIFVAVGVFFIQPANFDFAVAPGYTSFSQAVLLLIYAYVGFEAAVIPAGESKDPTRDLPFALFVALGFCTVLFILIQIVAIGTLPELAGSKTPLADAAGKFMGTFGAAFIAVGALISILGNLNGGFLAASRLPFAMAEHNELPRIIGKTHEKFKTPHISIILTAAVILVLTIYSSFFTAVTIATVTRLLVYATTCLSLPVFRRRKDVPEAKFQSKLGIPATIVSLVLIGWLLTDEKVRNEGLPILIAMAVGLIIFASVWLYNRSKNEAANGPEDE